MKKILLILGIIVISILSIIGIWYFSNYDNELVNVNEIKTDPNYENVIYEESEDVWSNDDIIGTLIIEKINLKVNVKEGTDEDTLLNYVGHIEETATYDGNIGLAGHNRGYNCAYFARINELKEGDILVYKTKFYERKYKVTKKVAIFEDDWSLLKDSKENKLTLITCIANKRNQRLCVQATEINN